MEPSSSWSLADSTALTYGDLSPVLLSQADDDPHARRQWEALRRCRPPVACRGNFHFELLQPEEDAVNCSGTLTLFTKPDFDGDQLELKSSVHQVRN